MKKAEIEVQSQVQAALDLLKHFDVFEDVYKTVNEHPIGVHILVPKESSTIKRPLLVKLHGGGFHEGASDLAWRPWTLELALKHNAVVVSPDYRLMPESEFPAMIDDLRDFWTWVDKDLEGILEQGVDASNVAIVGESAGGYLTAQSVQLGFSTKAAVVMMQYPCLAIQEHLAERKRDPADKQIPESIIDDYLAKVKPGAVISRAPFSTRMDLAIAAMQANRGWALDTHPELDPMVSLETAPRMPPVFLFHAIDDTYVSLNLSLHWVEKLKRVQPEAALYAVFPPGDHVLDKYHGLDEQWLKGPIAFVEEYWPVKRA